MKLSPRTAWLAFAALIAAGFLVWLGWPEKQNLGAAEPIGRHEENAQPAMPSEAAIESLAADEELAASPREAVPATPATTRETAQKQEPASKVAHLHVLARSQDDGNPLADMRVWASSSERVMARSVESSHGELGDAPKTDADGRADLEVDPETALIIFVSEDQGSRDTKRELEPLAVGESVELVFEFATREDIRLYGRLVDAESGSPLLGDVTIENGETELRWVETDSAGQFQLSGGSWERVFASARARGYARTMFAVTKEYDSPVDPLIVELFRAATLEAIVRDRAGVPIPGAQVTLSTESYRLQQSSSSMLDFYFDKNPSWRGKTDSDGRATIPDLLPRAPLRVSAQAKGYPRRDEAEPIELEPGELRRIELVLGAGATITGSLVDERGTPIGNRAMWRMVAEMPEPGMFEDYAKPAQKAKTDVEGRFRFEAVPMGTWWIGPAPNTQGPPDDVPPAAQVVVVIDELSEMEIVVRVQRGLFLSGRVFDPSGLPAKDLYVSAFRGITVADSQTNDDGEFSIGPLVAGNWTLEAGGIGDAHSAAEPVLVEAGRTGIVLQLRAGGSIAGEVVDRDTGERCECELAVSNPDAQSWFGTASRDGTIRFDGLPPGTYSISAKTRDGRIGIHRGVVVEAGTCAEGVRVQVAPGSKLVLRYEGAAENVSCRIASEGFTLEWTSLYGDHPLTMIVPPGTIEVHWSEMGEEEEVVEHVEKIDVGVEKQVELILKAGS